MIHHVYAEIEDLLRLSNYKLGEMFDRHGTNVRKELKDRLAKGEKLVGASGCVGFDPITGCPGHKS